MKFKTIYFNIDNIICATKKLFKIYTNKNIKIMSKLYDKVFKIILYPARYTGSKIS